MYFILLRAGYFVPLNNIGLCFVMLLSLGILSMLWRTVLDHW